MTEKVDRERILRLIDTLRKITLTVQVVPFIYTLFYLISLGVALSGNATAHKIVDAIFYVSPCLVLSHLLYSRILHLCIWHRTACVLPLVPMAISLFDYFFCCSYSVAIIIDIVLLLMFGLLLVAAYKVFYVRRK